MKKQIMAAVIAGVILLVIREVVFERGPDQKPGTMV